MKTVKGICDIFDLTMYAMAPGTLAMLSWPESLRLRICISLPRTSNRFGSIDGVTSASPANMLSFTASRTQLNTNKVLQDLHALPFVGVHWFTHSKERENLFSRDASK